MKNTTSPPFLNQGRQRRHHLAKEVTMETTSSLIAILQPLFPNVNYFFGKI